MPQWNADAFSHNALCTLFNRFGISALRLSKPYHDIRRPAETRALRLRSQLQHRPHDSFACRQAVVDIRSCLDWLESQGYEQFGVLGTSLGVATPLSQPPTIRASRSAPSTTPPPGSATSYGPARARAIFEQHSSRPASPRTRSARSSPASAPCPTWSASPQTPSGSWSFTQPTTLRFLREFSLDVLANFDRHKVDYVSKVLPCGHYTTGETPYKYIDGWYLGSFVYQSFKQLAEAESTESESIK